MAKSNDDEIKLNPCGICRAKRLKICKCAGGGGDGEDEEKKEDELDQDKKVSPELQPSPETIKDLAAFLEKSADWQQSDDNLYTFNAFNDEHPLQEMALNLGCCHLKLTPKPRENLDVDQIKQMTLLFKEIKDFIQQQPEGANLKIQMVNGALEISGFGSQKQFDALMVKLFQHNLLPTEQQAAAFTVETHDYHQNAAIHDKSWAPNPFDISRGPTPPTEQ